MALELSDDERTLCENRQNHIDYDALDTLYYLGNYVRPLSVNMARMMENAYDWEHLPFMHASSFSGIKLVDQGKWGWRAKLAVANDGGEQLIDLLVDEGKNYWATTVIAGPGQGMQIHTQATTIENKTGTDEIQVDVRFYLPEAPEEQMVADMLLEYMQGQYKQLYDEDLDLMSGRQVALNEKKTARNIDQAGKILIGEIEALAKDAVQIVQLNQEKFCIRHINDTWVAHQSTCPHLLGPLQEAAVNDKGQIMCPWHGYHFDITTGQNVEGKCKPLKFAKLEKQGGKLYLYL